MNPCLILTIYRLMCTQCEYIHGSGNKQSYMSSDTQYPDHRAPYRASAVSMTVLRMGFDVP